MSKARNTGPAAAVAEPEPASNPVAVEEATPPKVDPASEKDYWHVNYMTRPYYQQGRSFGDYEAAYRYGWENAVTRKDMTFEEAEKAHLAKGWATARGETRHAWEEVRDASRDAWARVRKGLKP